MAAYADAASLALHLGRDLTDAEEEGAVMACAAASTYIDNYTGKSWQGAAVTGELQTVTGPIVRLDRRPVASVTSVTTRSLVVGTAPRVLVAGVDYELLDALNGQLLVNGYGYRDVVTTTGGYGTVLTIAYVTASTPPPDIALAANIIAANYLVAVSAISGTTRGIQKLKAGSAEITYDPIESAEYPIPPTALALLDGYRPAVAFA